jgi:4-hydroxybenzoate polyprenyltransferase
LALASGATVLQFYSRPARGMGFRLKDLPSVKSFLPAGVIAGILVVWPWVENGRSFRIKEYLVLLWCPLVLTINSLVFDYRDIDGDSAIGMRTIPVQLGRRNTIYLLIGLAAALVGVSVWLATRGFVSPLLPGALAGGSVGLFFCGNQPDLSDDDQCLGRPITSGPCGRRNRCSSMAACAALKPPPPQCLDLPSQRLFPH